jgi:DNA adenine methylase
MMDPQRLPPSEDRAMQYPGGKNADGVYQRIINQIPPHDEYIELFGGSAAVLRFKRPAVRSFVLDLEPGALAALRYEGLPPGTIAKKCDGIHWLRSHTCTGRTFIYADPPYLLETRSKKRIYKYELTRGQHIDLLNELLRSPAMVMLSGYKSSLYASMLPGWRLLEYRCMTRGGPRIECLWMNYPEPVELHDYRYLGENFREREKVRRQQRRWTARLARIDRLQRLALLSVLGQDTSLLPSIVD